MKRESLSFSLKKNKIKYNIIILVIRRRRCRHDCYAKKKLKVNPNSK
jgi:hypothetical protein